ncbi:hypothetical protein JIG36_25405 [Actinoplanes sp. LDG1-06]|uniref:Uncharacterized protein n=1 Tax=Paractinoplanes ovalisporus TaxID=2810368 RepID=A0ABS2AGE8_9ACTN|nr:hypothetical protein [Actinoplanes ovalisporus]MBM2618901.1 hypothetical protein [Actinoplanes ovalisporus]
MNGLSTLPSTAEQARHALLLLGAPAAPRLVAEVHGALFDGDLSVPALAALRRDRSSGLCAALDQDLFPVRGLVALSDWELSRRIVTPAARRADALAMVIRVSGFVAVRPGRAAHRLLRSLAEGVPHGVEALDPADAARAALESEELVAALVAEEPVRAAAVSRAASLPRSQQLFGLPPVPHQRGAS